VTRVLTSASPSPGWVWDGPFAASVAWEGWIGALLGGVVSVLVAIYVLRRTLRQDRMQFLEQLRHERDLAREGQLNAAFGEVIAALEGYRRYPVDEDMLEGIRVRLATAVARWRVFLPSDADDFENAFVWACRMTQRGARDEAKRFRGLPATDPAKTWGRFVDTETVDWVNILIREGRRWHMEKGARANVVAVISQAIPASGQGYPIDD